MWTSLTASFASSQTCSTAQECATQDLYYHVPPINPEEDTWYQSSVWQGANWQPMVAHDWMDGPFDIDSDEEHLCTFMNEASDGDLSDNYKVQSKDCSSDKVFVCVYTCPTSQWKLFSRGCLVYIQIYCPNTRFLLALRGSPRQERTSTCGQGPPREVRGGGRL